MGLGAVRGTPRHEGYSRRPAHRCPSTARRARAATHPVMMNELDERLQATLGSEYVVEDRLGAGGYAVVFLVHDLGLKRRLAVKVVRPEMFASTTTLQRFRHEAETIAQLVHPNIVPLHFIGQKDDFVFLA